jgi:ArsR family transcriptional regulator, lead/cadmium/zinc/bismuth-responsive transcriptional repressor
MVGGVHLVPKEQRARHVLDDEQVCHAISGIGEADNVASWSGRFALLGDPSRLALLLGIHHAGPISVTDLAVAANMRDTAVSQALRLLRANGIVTAHREGRVVRYTLADDELVELLERVTPRAASIARFTAAH